MKTRSSLAMGWCPVHGKLLFVNRKTARKAARAHPTHKNEFQCDVNPAMWHIGELPQAVIRGEMTRDQYYGSAS